MHLFFFHQISNGTAFLDGEEARHCLKVLRMNPGDPISGIDGQGQLIEGTLLRGDRDSAEIQVLRTVQNWGEAPQKVVLAISQLSKPDRLEWLAEKAVELGVTELQVFQSRRTVRHGYRAERLEKIMISALKQCKRSRLPLLNTQPLPFEKVLQSHPGALRFIPWCEATRPLGEFSQAIKTAETVQFLIGPEGDFTEEEVQAASEAGFEAVSLGNARLRAETAGMYCLGVGKFIYGF